MGQRPQSIGRLLKFSTLNMGPNNKAFTRRLNSTADYQQHNEELSTHTALPQSQYNLVIKPKTSRSMH